GPNLPFVNYAERSRRLNHQHQDLSYGSEPRKPHSRARLRSCGRTWLCARPSRSALACGRAGNLGGIDGRARPRTRPAKEATVACTIEEDQDPRSGQLTPHITRGNTSAQTPSARGSRNKSFLLARRASQSLPSQVKQGAVAQTTLVKLPLATLCNDALWQQVPRKRPVQTLKPGPGCSGGLAIVIECGNQGTNGVRSKNARVYMIVEELAHVPLRDGRGYLIFEVWRALS